MENRPKLKSRVNLQLLEESLTAFFCSARCPGDLILETYDLARSMRNSAGSKRRWRIKCLRLLLRGNPARGHLLGPQH